MHLALGMKEEEQSKPKAVKFKVDEESDSDGLFSDEDMSYDSSDSDDSELEVTGGYYTKEMFLKKCVLVSLLYMFLCPLLCSPYMLLCLLLCPFYVLMSSVVFFVCTYVLTTIIVCSYVPCGVLTTPIVCPCVPCCVCLYVPCCVLYMFLYHFIVCCYHDNCYYGNVLLL